MWHWGIVRTIIVEDDSRIANQVKQWLEPYGYEVTLYSTAEVFLENFSQQDPPDLMIVDWMLPGMNGLELVKQIKSQENVNAEFPVILCSSKDHRDDIALALYAGADDFLTKPLCKTLLLARLFSILRRYRQFIGGKSIAHTANGDTAKGLGPLSDSDLALLSEKEYRVYQLLVQNKGQVISRELLIRALWPNHKGHEKLAYRPLDIVMSRLRKKVRVLQKGNVFIQTHYGKGYSLEEL